MPMLDMPLAELKTYQGTNPKPADFDEYWQRGLDEVAALDPEPEFQEASFQTEHTACFHLYFNGTGGARVHAKYMCPRNTREPHPALLQFHGYSVSSGEWMEKLPYTAQGFSVLALDCRGQGGLSEDPGGVKGNTLSGHIIRGLGDSPERLYFRDVFLDTVQLVKIAKSRAEIDPGRLGSFGESQGGALSLACAALNPEVKRVVSAYPFLADYQRIWEMDMAERAYEELKKYFRLYDPMHKNEAAIFETLGYIDIQHLAHRIQGEVLLATGLMDDICPPSSVFAVYNKIREPKQMLLYPDFRHERLPGFYDSAFRFLAGL